MDEVLTERLDVKQIGHVVFDAPPCDVALDGTAAFFSAADDLGDISEALSNGKWATLDQFRDDGHDGLVKLDLVVEAARPGFLSFTLAHPSPALHQCVRPTRLLFDLFVDQRADLSSHLYKVQGKSDAQLRATLASRTSGSRHRVGIRRRLGFYAQIRKDVLVVVRFEYNAAEQAARGQ
ncbi:hypothetical protein BC1002_4884 [Paraburkholderia atlantica]|uniref:Uncharacterized protein n=1 Tax=Paraburkholderia atlantica TaxID=2654982 RepID=D5WDN9_PARAM|nr:hypothetical protein [Paraburkholderia atlantica]ADG18842.1 hypothetical protein BC1002_4884 [Paraburkholderia atlantica]